MSSTEVFTNAELTEGSERVLLASTFTGMQHPLGDRVQGSGPEWRESEMDRRWGRCERGGGLKGCEEERLQPMQRGRADVKAASGPHTRAPGEGNQVCLVSLKERQLSLFIMHVNVSQCQSGSVKQGGSSSQKTRTS